MDLLMDHLVNLPMNPLMDPLVSPPMNPLMDPPANPLMDPPVNHPNYTPLECSEILKVVEKKKISRRISNNLAVKKCRLKKKEEIKKLEKTNQEFLKEIERLKEENEFLKEIIYHKI